MKTITTQQITEAVRQLCMDVSYDLPQDVEAALEQGLAKEESSFGKYCLEQIIHNCHLAREHQQAMCQDTGIAVVYLYIGQDVHIIGGSLADAVNEGVRQGYEDGYLRKSVVEEPLFERMNTGDNTPAVMHMELVPGDQLRIMVVPKGAGSENMGAMTAAGGRTNIACIILLPTGICMGGIPDYLGIRPHQDILSPALQPFAVRGIQNLVILPFIGNPKHCFSPFLSLNKAISPNHHRRRHRNRRHSRHRNRRHNHRHSRHRSHRRSQDPHSHRGRRLRRSSLRHGGGRQDRAWNDRNWRSR